MGEIITNNDKVVQKQENDSIVNFVEVTEGILLDTWASIENRPVISMPVAELATLGSVASSLLPAFRTITETTMVNAEGLYKLANASVGDVLKIAKNGNYWGAFKTAEGTSKFAQLQAIGMVPATTKTVMPLDPATIMIAVALFAIEQKLDNIETTQRRILSFLETEKEAKVESDMETLLSVLTKYKYSWDNECFVQSHHTLVLEIQRSSREHMLSYEKNITEILSTNNLVVIKSKVNDALNDLLRKFKYYRLALYSFSMASFVEIMLSGDFKEERFIFAKEEIVKLSLKYHEIFDQCSAYLERLNGSAIEVNVAKGIGHAGENVGKLIGKLPVIKDGQVDEFFQNKGVKIKNNILLTEYKILESFAEISNPGVGIFIEKLEDMIQIYGRTQDIYFDDKMIYLVAK